MRLNEEQVKQAILSPDQDVREAAVHYFSQSYSPDPSIMPLAIQAIEQYGWNEAFGRFFFFLQDLVQTDETVLWLVSQLKKHAGNTDEDDFDLIDAVAQGLAHADALVLQRHDNQILNLVELDEEAKETICQRIGFSSQTPDELWQQLRDFCERSDRLHKVPDDLALADNLVEALGRHPEFSSPKVLTILNGTPADNWMEVCMVRLAGELRLQEAIPGIVALYDTPDDWIFEEGHRALVTIGGDKVVEELARACPAGNADLRSSAADILGHIHSDLSVETCLKFFVTEDDQGIRCSLLRSVLMNFSTEGIEPARHFILHTLLDPDVLEVRGDLLTACKVMGERFPEFDAWVEYAQHDTEFRKDWYRTFFPSLDEFELDDEEELDDVASGPAPIVRKARVGRNDPCPCGSGKKFKKCCLKKQESIL